MKGSNGGFKHWQVSGLAISSCFSSADVHSVDCASFQPLRSMDNPSRLVFGFSSALPQFLTMPVHPPPPNQCKHPRYYLAHPTSHFLILFGRSFFEQQLVLGELLSTVKWSTFCASFISVLSILDWLQCFQIFKINYRITSNVQFGTVYINSVTNIVPSSTSSAINSGNYKHEHFTTLSQKS